MATNYPGAIDSLTNPSAGDALTSPSHSAQHANANDAIKAIETELGTDPSGASATVKARFEAIEANDWVTAARIAANAVGSSEIADSAVTSAKIADGAVTAAKLAVQPGNLLTENQASGTDTLGNTTGLASAAGATLTRRTDQARSGTGAVLVTATGTAAFDVYVQQDVTGGETYTFLSSVMGGSGSRTLQATVEWYTSGMSYIGQSYGNEMAPPGSWLDASLTVVAPASAAVARVKVAAITTGSVGDSFWIDALSWHKGSGGQWQLPGVPITGQGAIKANGAVELPGGDFAPEGVVTANPGSTFLQTSGAATVTGMLSWRKATGTGSTGWVAEGALADTGWRNVSASDAAKFQTWGALRIRRVGSQVFVLVRAAVGTGTASGTSSSFTLLTLPSGFQPTEYVTWGRVTVAVLSGAPAKIADLNTASNCGSLDLSSPSSGNWDSEVSGAANWNTTDAWPASLPGSAA